MKVRLHTIPTMHPTVKQDGFTIIELMVATGVLSILLLLATLIIDSIGNLYYKDVNQARIQDDSRSAISQVASDLKTNDGFLTSGTIPNNQAYCIGNVRYTYVIGRQLGSNVGQSPHILWRDQNPSQSSCSPARGFPRSPIRPGAELMPSGSRLVVFKIASVLSSGGSPYTVTLNVAYGDDDLLCSSLVRNSCKTSNPMPLPTDYTKGELQCKGLRGVGEGFCGTAGLTTTVEQRLAQ